MMPLVGEMVKMAASKTLVIKINLSFLTLFIILYVTLVLRPPSLYDGNAAAFVPCSLHDCTINKGNEGMNGKPTETETILGLFGGLRRGGLRIALVNIKDSDEIRDWESMGSAVNVDFDRVSDNLEWKDLFPEWIDEEEENEGPSCPEIPMPDYSAVEEVDVVAARLPEGGAGARDVFGLQVHLVAANVAARRGRRDRRGKVRVVVASGGGRRPMMEVFRCDDLVGRAGEWWVYEVDVEWLGEKVGMPIGSCKLALPLWQEGTNERFDTTTLTTASPPGNREAYATVLHSSDMYVCGAIALAHSILRTNTARDLVLLHDNSIPPAALRALALAGWTLRETKRIRNPRAQKHSYNEYNYTKFRLWLLTQYRKVVFVDADVLVLRSLDLLFRFPQISAVGNDGSIFNSGVMVIEPSECTFRALMGRRKDVVSYNGGDQGFLNEVFVWWHRLPRRVNFLKNFWSNTTAEAALKNGLFGADPPRLFAIHYLGLKPWLCGDRERDCNWDVKDQRVYASDVAHRRWWRVYDEMEEGLQGFCRMPGDQ